MAKWILQHTSPETEEIRVVVEPVNRKYANRHGFTYIVDSRQTFPPFQQGGPMASTGMLCPYWEKLRVIDECMDKAADGDFVEYIDIDAMHTKQKVDTSHLLPFGFDMSIRYDDSLPINAGVLFFEVNELTRTLIKRCLRYGPVSDADWNKQGNCGWEERRLYTEMLVMAADPSDPESYGLRVHPMDEKTHYYHPTQDEVILHVGTRSISDKILLLKLAIQLMDMKDNANG